MEAFTWPWGSSANKCLGGEPMVEIKNLSVTKTWQNHQFFTADSLDYQISSKETIPVTSPSWLNNADPEIRNFAIGQALALFLSPGTLSRCWKSTPYEMIGKVTSETRNRPALNLGREPQNPLRSALNRRPECWVAGKACDYSVGM